MATEQNLSHNRILVSLNALWDSLAADPPRQALESAQWCITHAPHLADALSAKIHASLPDSLLKQLLFRATSLELDGRIAALDALAHCKASYVPDPHRQIKAAAKHRKRQPKANRLSAKRAATATFEEIFDVTPQILPPCQQKSIRVDWEVGRLSISLQLAHQFRLWVLARDITRSEQGSGVITRRSLWEKVQAYRIPCTKRHFNRLLKDSYGLFWYCVGKRLYLRGIQPVSAIMTEMAREQGIMTETNLPGNRDVLLDPSGSLEAWEAILYAGWIAGRSEKGKWDVTIARETLEGLFGRDQTTLRRWEQNRLQHIIAIQHNIVQYVPDDDEASIEHIPDHAQPYLAQIRTTKGIAHETRLMWQIANTYHSTIESHSKKGQATKIRKAAQSIDDPANSKRGGKARLYFQSSKKLKAHQRSRKFRMGLLGEVNRPVYVFLGRHERSRRGVFEWTNRGEPITSAGERATPLNEAVYFSEGRASEQVFWRRRREAFID